MMTRCIVPLILLALMPATARSGLGDNPQSSEKSWRILIEGDVSVIPTMIEELRKSADEYNLKLVVVSKATDTYDLRIILTSGIGKTWDTNQPLRPGEIRFPIAFAFSAVAILLPDGKLVFTVAQSGNTLKTAVAAVAREAIKNIRDQGATLRQQEHPPNPKMTQNQASTISGGAGASNSISSIELRGEPGVYYKTPDQLVRLEDISVTRVKTNGMATALLTWGIAKIRVAEVYSKPRSSVQISERKPIFYIVGFVVSEQDVRIIRLQQKKDHREIRAASLSGFNQKVGYRADDIFKVTVVRVSDNVVAITPKSNLNPGEYLLNLSSFELRYDFGVSAVKN